jgi:hypothetical protein
MQGYECRRKGDTRDAGALCHYCSAALCEEHLFQIKASSVSRTKSAGVLWRPC